RTTKSPGLYCQMVGRGLRLHPGKTDALVLDVMGATTRHKLASIVDLTDRAVGALKDGQSLSEAVEEEELRGLQVGEVEWEDVDLFHASKTRWLQTHGGTWFIPAKDMYYFLARGTEPGLYRLRCWMKANGGISVPEPDLDHPLEYAK